MVTKVFALVLLSTLNSLATSDSYDSTQGSKDTCTTYESVQSTICHDGASCSRMMCAMRAAIKAWSGFSYDQGIYIYIYIYYIYIYIDILII